MVDQPIAQLFHRLGAIDRRLNIDIDVVGHGLGRATVGRDAQHRRDGVARGRAQAGGEDDELAAAGDDAAHAGGIVARRVHDNEALVALELRRIGIDGVDGAVTRLVDAAEGLLLEGRETARHVAGAGVTLAHLGTKGLHVLLVVAHDLEDLLAHLGRGGATGQDVLAAEELRGLAQHRRGTLGDQPVGDLADQRVGPQAAGGVGAAAVGAEDELGDRHVLAFAQACLADELAGDARALVNGLNGAADLLDDQRANGLVGALANGIDDQVVLAALAAKRHGQYRVDVGVGGKAGERVDRELLVDVHLAAAILVVERHAAGDGAGYALSGVGGADARGKDEHVVADAHLAVRTTVAAEGAGGRRRGRGGNDIGGGGGHVVGVRVLELIGAGTVVRVHMLARRDIGGGDTDVLTVLHDLLATLDIRASNLVEQWNVLASHDMALASARQRIGDVSTSLKLVNGNDDVVLFVDDDAVSHVPLLSCT